MVGFEKAVYNPSVAACMCSHTKPRAKQKISTENKGKINYGPKNWFNKVSDKMEYANTGFQVPSSEKVGIK